MSPLWVTLAAAILMVGDCRSFRSDDVFTNCVGKDVDAYLDTVIEHARKDLPDPMRLPPRTSLVDLSDGLMWGLSELSREGPATVICEGDTITINLIITTNELKGRYTWKKERKDKEDLEGFVLMITDSVQADVTLVIEKKEGEDNHPRLEKLEIVEIEDIRVEMTGMGLVTWVLGEMTTRLSGFFERAIARAIQIPIKEALERQMREISLD